MTPRGMHQRRLQRPPARNAEGWNQLVWGVVLTTPRSDAVPIGNAWDRNLGRTRGDTEPPRAMLFDTRTQARAWCAAANRRWALDGRSDWRAIAVRVRETVAVATPPINR